MDVGFTGGEAAAYYAGELGAAYQQPMHRRRREGGETNPDVLLLINNLNLKLNEPLTRDRKPKHACGCMQSVNHLHHKEKSGKLYAGRSALGPYHGRSQLSLPATGKHRCCPVMFCSLSHFPSISFVVAGEFFSLMHGAVEGTATSKALVGIHVHVADPALRKCSGG
jgi:hypothetical protein